MANIDQGAVMKKSILVLLLAAIHCGCATPNAPLADNGRALISYDEIAAEIKVSYQATSGPREATQPVAANMPD
jgi:hypothetical protein